jgi:hypothetical protein
MSSSARTIEAHIESDAGPRPSCIGRFHRIIGRIILCWSRELIMSGKFSSDLALPQHHCCESRRAEADARMYADLLNI